MANQSKLIFENNLVEGPSSVSYSGTEISGFEKENAYDYLDFSTFKPQVSATTNLDFTMGSSQTVQALGIFAKKVGGSGLDINVFYESSPSTFTSLGSFTNLDGALSILDITDTTSVSGRRFRIQFVSDSTQYEIRQIFLREFSNPLQI